MHHDSSDGVQGMKGVRECAHCGARAASIRIQVVKYVHYEWTRQGGSLRQQ